MLAGLPTNVNAQTWAASLVKEAADSATTYGTDSDAGCIYLYNVGSGEYINFGGLWGTQPMTHEVGMPLFLRTGTEELSGDDEYGTYYKIGTNNNTNLTNREGYIGYVRSNDTSTDGDENNLFIDPTGYGDNEGIVRMIFTQAGDTENDTIYTISFKDYGSNYKHVSTSGNTQGDWQSTVTSRTSYTTYYLVAPSGDNQVVYATTEDITDNKYAQWKIVTRKHLKEDFDRTNNPGQTEVANATFMVYDQNFNRNNAHQAKMKITKDTIQTNCVWKFTGTGTLNIGCGLSSSSSDQRTYGKYWLACISDSGTVYQEIEAFKGGWYQLRVKGFSTGTPAHVFIASIGENDSYVDAASCTSHNYTTIHQMDSSYSFSGYENNQAQIAQVDSVLISATSQYKTETYTMVYIAEGTKLVIGVEAFAKSGYTVIDDVQLYYTGQDATPLILDESWTNLDYINVQAKDDNTRTLLLKRTLVQDQWNSIVLPVSLTASQVREVFGDDTIFCELDSTANNGYDIYFASVADDSLVVSAVHDTVTVMQAGKPYIIKPSDLDEEEENYIYTLTVDSKTVTDTLKAPFFAVPMVTFTTPLENSIVKGSEVTSTLDEGIYMEGTYLAGASIPQYSYAISASNGLWYYLPKSGVTSKGFRAWIRTGKDAAASAPAMANLFIDGIQIAGDEATALEQIVLQRETSGSVYSLSGQMVSANGSLEGLPKGIYIMGGKKYVVK